MRQLCVHRDMKHLGSLEVPYHQLRLRLEHFLRIFRALRTSRVLHV